MANATQSCPTGLSLEQCRAKYNQMKKEATDLLMGPDGKELQDPSLVNQKITKAYSDMYGRSEGSLHWVGAAAIVSKQMGCNMRFADTLSDRMWGVEKAAAKSFDKVDPDELAKSTKTVLMAGNKAIFKDIYPQYRLFEEAPECIQKLAEAGEIDQKMADGFSDYEKAAAESDPAKAAELRKSAMMKHADYEQNVVLQGQVFDNAELATDVGNFDKAQELNRRRGAKGLYSDLRSFSQPEQVSFSSGCTAQGKFYFETPDGTFSDQSDRWDADLGVDGMAEATLERYDDLMNSNSGQMQDAIKDIGDRMGSNDLPNY